MVPRLALETANAELRAVHATDITHNCAEFLRFRSGRPGRPDLCLEKFGHPRLCEVLFESADCMRNRFDSVTAPGNGA